VAVTWTCAAAFQLASPAWFRSITQVPEPECRFRLAELVRQSLAAIGSK
jgi:hypothetical protein